MRPLDKLHNILDRIWIWAPLATRIFGAICFASLELMDNGCWKTISFVSGILIFGFGEFWGSKREKDIKVHMDRVKLLENNNNSLTDRLAIYQYSIKSVIDISVLSIYEAVKLNNTSRINLYLHDGHAFYLIARYSENEIYKKYSKRVVYPADQGCIAKAWELGEYLKNDLPDFKKLPDDYHKISQNHFSMPTEVSESLTMKCRSILGIRINNTQTKDNLAVIILESTEVGQFDLKLIEQIKKFTVWKSMCSFLEINKNMIPKPSDASVKGF